MPAGGHYDVLGLTQDATTDDVRKAFRRAARTCHPDVAGDDPVKARTWHAVREAYDTLINPALRAAHDRELSGGWPKRPRPPSGERTADPARNRPRTPPRWRSRPGGASVDDLDDLDDDLDAEPPTDPGAPGEDVHVACEVPWRTAQDGGRVEVTFRKRVLPSESWRRAHPGQLPPQKKVKEMIDVPVGVRHLEIRRYAGRGDAGTGGAASGDLVVRFHIVDDTEDDATPAEAPETLPTTIDISLVEALRGALVWVETPRGPVRLRIPPGTSSGRRFRLRARGPERTDGTRDDWLVTVRVEVPELDLNAPDVKAALDVLAQHTPEIVRKTPEG